jgi:hypothetical protein
MKTELTKAFTWLWLCLLSLIPIPSCSSRPHIDSRLIEAEHIINAHPDSALQMVRGVWPRNSVDSAYALYLTARAKDKLHIRDVDVDSLQEAVDYLETLPLADEEKALMHYYTGINQYNQDSIYRGVQEFYKSIGYQSDSHSRIGYLSNYYLAECFYSGYLFKESLDYSRRALEAATSINNAYGQCMVNDLMAITSYMLNDFDSATYYASTAIEIAQTQSYTQRLAISYNTMGTIQDAKGNHSEALEYSNQALALYPKADYPLSFYATRCDIWRNLGVWDSVNVYLRRWQECVRNANSLAYIYDRFYQMGKLATFDTCQIVQYADSALYYHGQESEFVKAANWQLRELHDSYQAARQQRSQSQADTHLYIIGALVVLLLMSAIYYYHHTHTAKADETSPSAPGRITREQLREAESQMFAPCAEADLLKSLQQKADLTITQEQRQVLMQHLMKVLTPTIQTLQQEYPKLNSEHCLICLLSYYGFATGACAALFNSNDSAVRQRKYRLKSILTEADFLFFFKK